MNIHDPDVARMERARLCDEDALPFEPEPEPEAEAPAIRNVAVFSDAEIRLLTELASHFQVDLLRDLRRPDLTDEGRAKYAGDLNTAQAALAKLRAFNSNHGRY